MLTRVHPGRRTVFAMWSVSVVLILLVHAVSLECSSASNFMGNQSYGSSGTYRTNSIKVPKVPKVPLCCPLEHLIVNSSCEPVGMNDTGVTVQFPDLYSSEGAFEMLDNSTNVDTFRFVNKTPCPNGGQRYPLEYSEFKLLDNGTIYMIFDKEFRNRSQYCLGRLKHAHDRYDIIACFEEEVLEKRNLLEGTLPVGMILSIPFLFLTFLVYTVIPELKNMHGRTLRGYVGSLLVSYLGFGILNVTTQDQISDTLCIVFAFVINFSFLASFFWLNVMCFDIWWTFGGFRSLQGSVKQREQKKFIIYSIYAWGCASILTVVCAIMEFVPGVPDSFIRPQFGLSSCWFESDDAKAVYFYGPMGITVLCNICLFISTAMKIAQHKKATANHLKGVDSRRHDDNKQWFNLYLKLFIVMGINWAMEIISWLCDDSPKYIWIISDLTNALQGVIIFLIFVWKEKIRRLLLKRFRCHSHNVLSSNSSRSAYHSSASRTCTTNSTASTQMLPLSATKSTPASTLFQEPYKPYSSNDRTKLPNDNNDYP
ncbi:G-protein coupled receptor Mth2 isoform X2 [Lasioglossum baleicum]|uniref:G-protein coupled receptor Mth2 isoform X2 n=1 Tax=Lasioglossum baleicum TaxID=434251 RepID=UPI003FCC921F